MSKNTSIVLGPQINDFIERKISDGRFASVSEAVRAGMRLLVDQETRLDALRQAVDSGFAGNFKEFDISRIKNQLDSEK